MKKQENEKGEEYVGIEITGEIKFLFFFFIAEPKRTIFTKSHVAAENCLMHILVHPFLYIDGDIKQP